MSYELKIKAVSLAAEAKLIREEENRCKRQARKLGRAKGKLRAKYTPERMAAAAVEAAKHRQHNQSVGGETCWQQGQAEWTEANRAKFWGLRQHRKWDVRDEARSTHLARGFLRNMPYRTMENEQTTSEPDYYRVAELVRKYGPYAKTAKTREEGVAIIVPILKLWVKGELPVDKTAEAA